MVLEVSNPWNSVQDLDTYQISTEGLEVCKPMNSVGDLDIWQISTIGLCGASPLSAFLTSSPPFILVFPSYFLCISSPLFLT